MEGENHFYNAVKSGDSIAVQRLLPLHKHWHESRMTNQQNQIYNSFSGLHYACLFKKIGVLNLLLKY